MPKAPNNAKIIQLNATKDKQRVLIPIKSSEGLKLFKYLLVEQNKADKNQVIGSLISKTKITAKTDLFLLPLATDGSINYFDATANKNVKAKLQLKYNGNEINIADKANTAFRGSSPSPDNAVYPIGYCIDHWWVTYDADTGQILSIEYMGSDCYGCAETGTCEPGGSGGGGGQDSSALYNAIEAEYSSIDYDLEHCMDHTALKWVDYNTVVPTSLNVVWPIAMVGSHYIAKAHSTTVGNVISHTDGKTIHVDNLKTDYTSFECTNWYLFFILKWAQKGIPVGFINNNDSHNPTGDIEAAGEITIESRMPATQWAIINPTRPISKTCTVSYMKGIDAAVD